MFPPTYLRPTTPLPPYFLQEFIKQSWEGVFGQAALSELLVGWVYDFCQEECSPQGGHHIFTPRGAPQGNRQGNIIPLQGPI